MQEGSKKAIVAAFFANLRFAISKFVGFLNGSAGMLAEAAHSVADTDDAIHMRTEHLGPDEILLTAKVEYDSRLTFDEAADAINASEANVRSAVLAVRLIYIEPDFRRPVAAE